MINNEEINMTECSQVWDFLYVRDAADALYLFGENEKAEGIYHVASGCPQVLKEFVLQMAELTQTKSKLNFGAISYPSTGAVNIEPTVERLKKELDWQPKVSFKEGIENILLYMKKRD